MSLKYRPLALDDEVTHAERSVTFRIRNIRLNYQVLFFSILSVYIMTLASFGIARSYPSGSKNLLKSQRMLPDFPNTLVTFLQDDHYVSSLAGEPNSPWNDLAPSGKGFIKVESPATWDLHEGYPVDDDTGSGTEIYCISMYHQLHCLAVIKMALTDQHAASHSQHDGHTSTSANITPISLGQSPITSHLDHCVDYLRQAIMCAGDTTLERAAVVNGQIVGEVKVDGWGVTHQCRDWQSIYSFTAEHRYSNTTGIS